MENKELTAPIYDLERNEVGSINLPSDYFDVDVPIHLFHQVVRMQEAKHRQGTASTKGRSDVNYSTAKIFRQKGTGRARAGSRRSPIRYHGGVTFGPKPRDFSIHVPKKVRKKALSGALTNKFRDGKLFVINDFSVPEIKTKQIGAIIDKFNVSGKTLFVIGRDNGAFKLSTRNIPTIKTLYPEGLNVRDLLLYDNLFILKDAIPTSSEKEK